jgi:hypothetical protein
MVDVGTNNNPRPTCIAWDEKERKTSKLSLK